MKNTIFYNIKMLHPGIKKIYSIIIAQDWDENGLLAISVVLNTFPCKYFFWNKSHLNEIILLQKNNNPIIHMISFPFFLLTFRSYIYME